MQIGRNSLHSGHIFTKPYSKSNLNDHRRPLGHEHREKTLRLCLRSVVAFLEPERRRPSMHYSSLLPQSFWSEERSYHKALELEEAMAGVLRRRGGWMDAAVLPACGLNSGRRAGQAVRSLMVGDRGTDGWCRSRFLKNRMCLINADGRTGVV